MSDVTRSASPSITMLVRGLARILSALILLAASLFLLCWRLSRTQTQIQR